MRGWPLHGDFAAICAVGAEPVGGVYTVALLHFSGLVFRCKDHGVIEVQHSNVGCLGLLYHRDQVGVGLRRKTQGRETLTDQVFSGGKLTQMVA